MSGDAALLAGQAMLLVSAAVAAFGQAVLSNAPGEARAVAGAGSRLVVVFGERGAATDAAGSRPG